MHKLRTFVKILAKLLQSPKNLTKLIDYQLEKKEYVIKNYSFNNGLPVIDLLDLSPDLDETITPYSFLEGSSLITDIALLKILAKKHSNCKYLEIGTWRGESIANVASIAKECVSIDLPEEEMRKMNLSREFINLCDFFSKNIKNIQHIKHDSQTFDFSTLKEKFDLIFIDGDHSYESVKNDTRNVFKLLKNDSSIIVWHDYYMDDMEKIRWDVLAGILDGCPETKRKSLYYVSNTLCAIYVQGEFKTKFIILPQIPNKKFVIKLSIENYLENLK